LVVEFPPTARGLTSLEGSELLLRRVGCTGSMSCVGRAKSEAALG